MAAEGSEAVALVVHYPGRVCLLGEHCDWAGGASLTVPLPIGVRLAVEDTPGAAGIRLRTAVHGELHEQRIPLEGAVDPAGGVLRFAPACAAALHARGIALRPCALWVHASLPPARGFSSSAAYSLAVLDGLARHAGHELDAATLAELAFHVEHELLGVACGRLDPLACVAAAPVFLPWRPDGTAPLRRVALAAPVELVVAAFRGSRRDTPAILAALRAAHGGRLGADGGSAGAGQRVRAALATFASEAEAGVHALEAGRLEALGAAMWRCQEAYEEAAEGVPALAAPMLQRLCRALRERGVLGAKFSGAGGDGSVVTLARSPDEAAALAELLRDAGLSVWHCRLAGP